MDEETRKLIQNLIERIESSHPQTTQPQTPLGSPPQPKRPNIFSVGTTSLFSSNPHNLMPDSKLFRKLLGIDF